MPAFIDKDGAAVEVFRGVAFVDRDGFSRSDNWLTVEPPEVVAAAGIVDIAEPPTAPEGRRIVPGPLENRDGVPTRSYTLEDAPAPQPDPVPESVTNSDWRVGLILWGRFAEVEAKVIAARDSGTVQGAIVWQRWEYANEVLRTELLALHGTFGFTTEEVDESLIRAAKVPEQTRAQAEAVLAARAT